MKIVHVVRQYLPFKGGMEFAVHDLARTQAAMGHSVKVVTLDRKLSNREETAPASEVLDGVSVIRVPFFGSSRYPIAPAAITHLKNADLVHVHGVDFFFDYIAFMNLFLRKTLVASTHGGFFHTSKFRMLKNIWFNTITRFNIQSYGAVISISEQDYQKFSKLRRDGVKLVYNGIDVEKFHNSASKTPVKTLFALSRFSINKNVDQILDVLEALNRNDVWRLELVGNPDDLSLQDVLDMVEQRGLQNVVTVHTGLSNAEISTVIGRCSLFVSASSYEGFGIAAVEALSAGLELVLSDIKPYRDLRKTTGSGRLTDFSDVATTAAVIKQIYHTLEVRPDNLPLDANIARYSLSKIANQLVDIYNDCLGEGRRSILGMPTSVLSRDQAIGQLDNLIGRGTHTPVFFANPNLATQLRRSPTVSQRIGDSLVLNDGVGMDIASMILYRKAFPANLNGTDFLIEYFEKSEQPLKIFLLGARPGVARRAAEILAGRHTKHEFVGHCHGYFESRETNRVISQIKGTGANVLLCAMGNPKQEEWILQNLPETGCDIGIGVGAFYDFVTEAVPRAPLWVRHWRSEWIYRLVQEPKRMIKRYTIGNAVFLYSVLMQYLRGTKVS